MQKVFAEVRVLLVIIIINITKIAYNAIIVKKIGHKEVDCWSKKEGRREQKQANFTENSTTKSNMFMTQSSIDKSLSGVWFMDSGCSNHMSGNKSLFKELDESDKGEVRLGDDKPMSVEGKGIISIRTIHGNTKLLSEVQYVPKLAHNLSSVGQLIRYGYKVVFDDDCCVVYDKKNPFSVLLK